ncbi:MAG: ABC-type transport auxiliary lipoprotein family protein [Pseudomonadota bacterium]
MRLLSLTVSITALTLAGCVSVLPEPERPDALYRIAAMSNPVEISSTIMVREPEAPQIMSGRAMVREDMSGAMRLIPSVEWAGRSTRLMQLALVDSLVGEAGGAVLPEAGAQALYELSTRISTVGFVRNDAVCEATVTLIDARTRNVVTRGQVATRLTDQVNDPASTLKRVSETCVAEIAAFVESALSDEIS